MTCHSKNNHMNKKTKKEIKAIYQEIARLNSLIHESKEKPTKEPINSLHDYEVKGDIELKHKIIFPDVKETEIDWNIQGQILDSNISDTVVISTGVNSSTLFSGFMIFGDDDRKNKNTFRSDWMKDHFKLSNKTLKLE